MVNCSTISKASFVTEPVTKASPPVTAVANGVVAGLNPAQRDKAKLMHTVLVVALGVAARDKGRVGPAGYKTLWVETLPDYWVERAPDRTYVATVAPTIDEIALAELVLPALLTEFNGQGFHRQLLMGRALGMPWSRIMRKDPHARSDRMLRYLHQWLLYRLWVRLQNKLKRLLPRLPELC